MRERLQKIIARAGLASRRKAEEMIRQGLVTVNGQVVTQPGASADPREDHVKVAGKLIRPEPLQSYLVYKPRNVLSSVSDPGGRPVVTQLVPPGRRLYPAGRLDFESEGLIVLTNDGELAKRITQAGLHEKRYRVKVRGVPDERKLKLLRSGLRIRGERFYPCQVRLLKAEENSWLEVRLRQGKNRQIRRMFEHLGHWVMRLRRVGIGPLELGDLKPGGHRRLTSQEVELLKAHDKPRAPRPRPRVPRSRPRTPRPKSG